MRAGDKVIFDVEGDLDGDDVVIGCRRFTLGQVAGASKSARIKGGKVKIKGAAGTVIVERGRQGRLRVEFAGIDRRFLAEHVENQASSEIRVKGSKKTGQRADAQQADPATLRWQDGDKVVWDEPGHTGPRVRRFGQWVKEQTGRRMLQPGRRRNWTDDDYDEKIRRGQVKILRKGGVDFA